MPELHILVVFDVETKTYRVGDLTEAPVDSDEGVWDGDADEWRPPTDEERDIAIEAEGFVIEALRARSTRELVSIETTCATCGDSIVVPGDEDPEDTLCVACAEDEQGS